jgi:hypothetical protein
MAAVPEEGDVNVDTPSAPPAMVPKLETRKAKRKLLHRSHRQIAASRRELT